MVQLERLVDRSVGSGVISVLGEDDIPSAHCIALKTCGTISSPTWQGVLISNNLLKREIITKIFIGEITSKSNLFEKLQSQILIQGARNRNENQLSATRVSITRALGVEYKPSQIGDLLFNKASLTASKSNQYPGSDPMNNLMSKKLFYEVCLSQLGFVSAWLAISSRICSILVLTLQFQAF